MDQENAFRMQHAEARIAKLASPRSVRLQLISETYTKDGLQELIRELSDLRIQFFDE